MMSAAPDEIEGNDERPKERPYADRQKRDHCQYPGREVAVGGEGGEAGRQLGPTTPGMMKTSPKKRKLCRVAMARCASTWSSALSLGHAWRRSKAATGRNPRRDVSGRRLPATFGLLLAVDRRGLENCGQDAEPAFHEISSQVGCKLREVRPHHHAEIWRRRRPRRAQLGDPGFGGLSVVAPCQCAETGRLDRAACCVGC